MISRDVIQERVERFPARCREAGLKVTHQRVSIYRMLASSESHPSPDEVYARIRKNLPNLSLGTVYKVLDQFHQNGFVRRVSTEKQVARYDANLAPHHHLNCSCCGRIQDITDALKVSGLTDGGGVDFQVSHHDVIFHGVCSNCQ